MLLFCVILLQKIASAKVLRSWVLQCLYFLRWMFDCISRAIRWRVTIELWTLDFLEYPDQMILIVWHWSCQCQKNLLKICLETLQFDSNFPRQKSCTGSHYLLLHKIRVMPYHLKALTISLICKPKLFCFWSKIYKLY